MHRPNWDDLRFVLAVAETGSVSKAARRLGVNHATVLRRVADFEQRHGAAVFHKTTQGYRVLADKQDVIKAAKVAEGAMTTVGQLAGGHTGELRGKSRITSTDTFCQVILPKIISDLQQQAKGLFIEVISSNPHIDLSMHQVDLAIRPALSLPEGLEGDVVADLGFAVYTSGPATQEWLGLSGPLARSIGGRWMAEHITADKIVAASDSFFVLRELAATGCGQAILPCFLGDRDPRLHRAETSAPHFKVPIWVANHIDQSTSQRTRVLRSSFTEALVGMKDHLLG